MSLLSYIPGVSTMKELAVGAVGLITGAAALLGWAVFFYGPAQYDAGGTKMAAELDAASRTAQGELTDDAERFRFRRAECRARGIDWVFDFATGECESRPAE